MNPDTISPQADIKVPISDLYQSILTREALDFLVQLQTRFNPRRLELLALRKTRQDEIDNGVFPDFLKQTQNIRESEWTVAPLPSDLLDRRVEITGPVERKMIINALNSGASVFMADFEDSNSPTWQNTIEGQINLRDAVRKTITYTNPDNNKHYALNEKHAVLMVRPRGWHLDEKHVTLDGQPFSGSLFDFGLYFFHNVKQLLQNGTGPYFYLPKLESHLEARLWNDVFVFAQNYLNIPQGTIKATVLVETILASFELNEILYELREHSAGLNCGRWDYIFSYIKKFRKHPDFLVPDRAEVGMTQHFMRSYSRLVIQTCHRRNVHAMGGMAAQIPIKNDEKANAEALEKVRQDKIREVTDGHDGTWVAHPGLVSLAKDIFDHYMPQNNQIDKKLIDLKVTREDLLQVPAGNFTEEQLVRNIDIGVQYLGSWLNGNGCVPIYNLMEDAATAEISRTQVWQWIHNPNTKLSDGRAVTPELYHQLAQKAKERIIAALGNKTYVEAGYERAFELFNQFALEADYSDFLTLNAYRALE